MLIGAIAPDLPLFGLSLGGAIWFGWWQGWPADQVARHLFNNLFFNDPAWISLHNLLHSPLVCLVAILLLMVWKQRRCFDSWWTWFFVSCLAHTLVDIPVHHDDGPLLLWPLNWSWRYASPVSYWDPEHYGQPMMAIEGALFVMLAARMIALRWRRGSAMTATEGG